jgi:hypothetical protein
MKRLLESFENQVGVVLSELDSFENQMPSQKFSAATAQLKSLQLQIDEKMEAVVAHQKVDLTTFDFF